MSNGSKSISAPKRNLPLVAVVENGASATSHNADYSAGSSETIKHTPAGLDVITSLIVYVEDTGDFDPTKFGVDVVLTNGIDIAIYDTDDNVLKHLTATLPIIDNYDFMKFTPDVQVSANSGAKNILVATFYFQKAIMLDGEQGEYLGITLDDDLSDLTDLMFTVIGYVAKEVIGG